MRLFFILIFIPGAILSQSTLDIHLNSRNAKDTCLFDYYSKIELTHVIDSNWTFYVMGNYERDNGIEYYSYSGSVKNKYLKVEYFKDTEIDREFTSFAVTYPIKIFRIGYNLLVNEDYNHAIYLRAEYKFLSSEVSFFDEIHICKVGFSPKIKIKDNIKLGFSCNYMFIDEKEKWEAGLNFQYILIWNDSK